MKLKDGLLRHEIMGEAMLVPTGKISETFNGIVKGNETAGFILKLLQDEHTQEELVQAVLEEYDAQEEIVKEDVARVLSELENAGLLE